MSSLRHQLGYTKPYAPMAKPKKNKSYLAFLHRLPCVVTGTYPVEAAHVSYAELKHGATGRGKSQKASDRFALPLCPDEHRTQHSMNEREYWRSVGIDPHALANALYAAFEADEDALMLCQTIIEQHRYGALELGEG